MNKEIDNLLALICVIEWLANDLHYNSFGNGFYEKHLLADRIRDFDVKDEIKETYYLGWKGVTPTLDSELARLSTIAYGNICTKIQGELQRLIFAYDLLIKQVEVCKSENGLPGGIHSILDGISQKALTYKFLVTNESKNDIVATSV